MKKSLLAFFGLILDVALATIAFAVILAGAYVLHHIVAWAQTAGFPNFIIIILRILEYAIFVIDAILLLWLVVRAAIKCGNEIGN